MLGKSQAGLGLVEVLVSLVILAVAVLGFSAMQMRAIKATDESLSRSDAMMVIRNMSESMRLYPSSDAKQQYINAIAAGASQTVTDCKTKTCTRNEQIASFAQSAWSIARDNDMRLGAMFCPGTSTQLQKVCIIASWDETQPTMGAGANACADVNGIYKAGASCFVMETY